VALPAATVEPAEHHQLQQVELHNLLLLKVVAVVVAVLYQEAVELVAVQRILPEQ
jgi:hypothetical protein